MTEEENINKRCDSNCNFCNLGKSLKIGEKTSTVVYRPILAYCVADINPKLLPVERQKEYEKNIRQGTIWIVMNPYIYSVKASKQRQFQFNSCIFFSYKKIVKFQCIEKL